MTSRHTTSQKRGFSRNKWTSVNTQLPEAHQSDSLLCCLPSDIRWLILRELLVSPQPLSTREEYEGPGQTVDSGTTSAPIGHITVSGHHLNTNILRTCQLLSREGLRVLYLDNTLCIQTFHRQQFPQSKLSHVNTWLYISAYKMHHVWYSSTCCYAKYDSFYLDQESHRFARKFHRFKLTIDPDSSPDLFRLILSGAFEVLESVFRGANVHLAIDKRCYGRTDTLPEETAWRDALLSCGRYKIDGRDPTQSKAIMNFSRKEVCPPPRELWPRNLFWKTLYASNDGARQTKTGSLANCIFENAWNITRTCIRSTLANIADSEERKQRRLQLEEELNDNILDFSQQWKEILYEVKPLQEGRCRYWWKLKHNPIHAFM